MIQRKYFVLKAFLHSPSVEKYGREIEREIGISHEQVVRYLKAVAGEGIIFSEKKGRQIFYWLNKKNSTLPKILAFLEMERCRKFLSDNRTYTVLLHDLKSDILSEVGEVIQFILLFGSVSRGDARRNSDVDLLFVTSFNSEIKEKIEKIIEKRAKITGRSISPQVVTMSDLKESWHREPIYKNIWEERMVLYGEERFWEFVLEKGEPL